MLSTECLLDTKRPSNSHPDSQDAIHVICHMSIGLTATFTPPHPSSSVVISVHVEPTMFTDISKSSHPMHFLLKDDVCSKKHLGTTLCRPGYIQLKALSPTQVTLIVPPDILSQTCHARVETYNIEIPADRILLTWRRGDGQVFLPAKEYNDWVSTILHEECDSDQYDVPTPPSIQYQEDELIDEEPKRLFVTITLPPSRGRSGSVDTLSDQSLIQEQAFPFEKDDPSILDPSDSLPSTASINDLNTLANDRTLLNRVPSTEPSFEIKKLDKPSIQGTCNFTILTQEHRSSAYPLESSSHKTSHVGTNTREFFEEIKRKLGPGSMAAIAFDRLCQKLVQIYSMPAQELMKQPILPPTPGCNPALPRPDILPQSSKSLPLRPAQRPSHQYVSRPNLPILKPPMHTPISHPSFPPCRPNHCMPRPPLPRFKQYIPVAGMAPPTVQSINQAAEYGFRNRMHKTSTPQGRPQHDDSRMMHPFQAQQGLVKITDSNCDSVMRNTSSFNLSRLLSMPISAAGKKTTFPRHSYPHHSISSMSTRNNQVGTASQLDLSLIQDCSGRMQQLRQSMTVETTREAHEAVHSIEKELMMNKRKASLDSQASNAKSKKKRH